MTDPTADPDYRPGVEDDPTADPVVGPDDDGVESSYQPDARAEYVKVCGCGMHGMVGCRTRLSAAAPPADCLVLQLAAAAVKCPSTWHHIYDACMNSLNLCSAAARGEACSRCCDAHPKTGRICTKGSTAGVLHCASGPAPLHHLLPGIVACVPDNTDCDTHVRR